jgi:hypothetical protein
MLAPANSKKQHILQCQHPVISAGNLKLTKAMAQCEPAMSTSDPFWGTTAHLQNSINTTDSRIGSKHDQQHRSSVASRHLPGMVQL